MYETDEDIRSLQELLDHSHARMGAYMRSILTRERTLTARQVTTYLHGIRHVAFAAVTSAGEPRVAPLDALFIRGRFHVGSGRSSIRVRHLRRRPKVSLAHFVGDEVAVTVHGTVTLMERSHPDVAAIEPIYLDLYGSSPFGWSEHVMLMRVEPQAMYAYAPQPERFPEGTADRACRNDS
ncbi:MAG: hypothetical protein AUH29_14900 [Candidatus Rokubacteria bacterium 13_1_40CM_69_27]|nr:MAG: hypothetical protein AUH29_14900 [Candidatus Rokubacteria bacterium 13_1_40CM_69_27]OLE38147.1 MAG: hypothetical protein AUG00_06200 [Candidatus Rokubacteria bacterium 13_1_20CM_2_70_7]